MIKSYFYQFSSTTRLTKIELNCHAAFARRSSAYFSIVCGAYVMNESILKSKLRHTHSRYLIKNISRVSTRIFHGCEIIFALVRACSSTADGEAKTKKKETLSTGADAFLAVFVVSPGIVFRN